MKTFTQNTFVRNPNPSSRANTGMFSSLVEQQVFKGKLQHFLESLCIRLFVFYKFAPVPVHPNKGGKRPISRDIQNMD